MQLHMSIECMECLVNVFAGAVGKAEVFDQYNGHLFVSADKFWLQFSANKIRHNVLLFCTCCGRLDEAKQWLNGLSNSGGCNLLAAVKHIYRIKDVETACIVVGSL